MNFHYDPIFGLQYTVGYGVITLDIEALPKLNLNSWKEAVKSFHSQGVQFFTKAELTRDEFKYEPSITTNAYLA